MALQARLAITGRVQGVGYRDWAVATGQRLGLSGWVRNRTFVAQPISTRKIGRRPERSHWSG